MVEQCRQSINFYQEQFRKPVITLPAVQMLQVIGIVAAGLLLISLYLHWSLSSLTHNIQITEVQKGNLLQRLATLQSEYVEPKEDETLLTSLMALNSEIFQQEELQRFLQRESQKISFSFSAVMTDLAQNDSRKVWLNRIEIKSTGSNYKLHGLTEEAEAIPEYIEQLKAAQSLKGSAFSLFNMERDQRRSRVLHFTLSSEEGEE